MGDKMKTPLLTAMALCSLTAMTGCAPYPQSYSASRTSYSAPTAPATHNKTPSNIISVSDDQYQPYIEYSSEASVEGPLDDSYIWVLVARKDRASGVVRYYTQWGNFYTKDGWKFYFKANDSKATALDFDEVDREVGKCYSSGCTHTETYNITFTSEQMAVGASEGLNFKVYAQDGSSRTTTIPATLVKALVDKVNAPTS
jgi:hypothetical protein